MKRTLAALAFTVAAVPGTAVLAQTTQNFSVAPNFMGFTFADGLGVSAASLLMLPVAYEIPITRTFSLDAYGAYARGSVEISDTVYSMNGFVDTRVRLNWTATPWAMITVGLNLPTGHSEKTSEEAIVANVLATEVLGFREASWGLGFGATTGLATAYQVGRFGVGLGASYRLASEFTPRADTTLSYTPGNETRVRLALDTNLGGSKLTGGVTFQNYTKDKLDGRDLFQAGARWRGDLALSFRTGSNASWTLYAADIWREHGDVTLQLTDGSGRAVRDSTFSTGKQNILVAGLAGAVRLSSSLSVRPNADVRFLTREEQGGEGWVAGVGGDVPLRWGSLDLFPAAKFNFGQLEAGTDDRFSATGGEVGLTIRWSR